MNSFKMSKAPNGPFILLANKHRFIYFGLFRVCFLNKVKFQVLAYAGSWLKIE